MVSFRWGKATETRDDVAVSLRVLGVVLEALGPRRLLARVGVEAKRECRSKCERAT